VNNPNWYAPPAPGVGSPVVAPTDLTDRVPTAEYAGFAIRAGARMLDTLAVGIVNTIGGGAAGMFLAILQAAHVIDGGWVHRLEGGNFAVKIVVGTAAVLAYHVLAESIGGATLGKLALGLRVRSMDLTPCTLGGAILRSLGYYIDAFFFAMPAYGSMSRSPQKQRIGDKWGKTVVVKAASLGDRRPTAGRLAMGIVAGAGLSLVIELGYTLVAAL
jgi:uncharacterized RDD family membrane protein YckC